MCGDLAEQTKINRKLMEMLHLELEPVGIFFGNTSAELSYYALMAIYVFMGLWYQQLPKVHILSLVIRKADGYNSNIMWGMEEKYEWSKKTEKTTSLLLFYCIDLSHAF